MRRRPTASSSRTTYTMSKQNVQSDITLKHLRKESRKTSLCKSEFAWPLGYRWQLLCFSPHCTGTALSKLGKSCSSATLGARSLPPRRPPLSLSPRLEGDFLISL